MTFLMMRRAVPIICKLSGTTLFVLIFLVCSATASFAEEKSSTPVDMKRPYEAEAFKHYNRAVELHQAGFIKEAEVEYLAAVKSDSRMEEAWSNLGGIYAAREEYSKAIECFNKALAIAPHRATTLNGSGCALLGLNRIDEAIDKFHQGLRSDPSSKILSYNLGRALERQNQLESHRTTHVVK